MDVLSRHAPSGPVQRNVAIVASPVTRDPAGSEIVTSTDPPSRERMYDVQRWVVLTSSLPSANSTRTCSAALTSARRSLSLGRTSTTVSARSPASIRTSPTAISTTAEMGSGVSNSCITDILRRFASYRPQPVWR